MQEVKMAVPSRTKILIRRYRYHAFPASGRFKRAKSMFTVGAVHVLSPKFEQTKITYPEDFYEVQVSKMRDSR